MYLGTYTHNGSEGIYAYRSQPSDGRITGIGLAAETINPSFLAVHPNHRYLFAVNEISNFEGKNGIAAEIDIHQNETFIYGSNRGLDSTAVFALSGDKGMVEPMDFVSTPGRTPRHFAIDPTGNYIFVANRDSDSIVLFRINRNNGTLVPTGTVLEVPTPVCVTFAP